ncbi:Clavaminate synthase-like protein [Lasiosphaeris hirsuta]|uniref:Clavaminate synthase-like protein n=1 Tax=Lasiosphaeris hirsuta TaxID=260670 RepID=A0AA40BC99_9PEZI|nr:Clavaminate synthase-like protein [Lasiosphaeris hirsuta]
MLLPNNQRHPPKLSSDPNGAGSCRQMTDDQDVLSIGSSIPTHPLGIKPLGNKYFASGKDARRSLGTLQVLPDEMLMQLLEYLGQRTLRLLGYSCRFLFASCISDDLWKSIFLESELRCKSSFEWRGTWRATVLGFSADQKIQIDCGNVFSDVLHRPFVCSHISLGRYTINIPAVNAISRFEDLTYQDFAAKWSNKPFILTECIKPWPAYQSWDTQKLLKLYSNVSFRAEAVDWSFTTYCQYMSDNHDESPLYLFDRKFAEKMKLNIGNGEGTAYWKPECFGPDLFQLLGDERPAHRWLIIGPERSGSTFHKDPNATSAWNAVIRGAKYWIMFPPSALVPGVYVSKDNSEVTSPLSIAEWLLEFHAEARQLPECREGICQAGEILYVPSGWWHLVVNLEAGIALTQNFVPKSHIADVLAFLKDRPEQVTGFKKDVTDPYGLFVDRLREEYPGLLEDGLNQLAERQAQKKRRWDIVVGKTTVEEDQPQKKSTGFSFGFGFGDDEDEIP